MASRAAAASLKLHLVVRAEELTDDDALVVSGLLVEGGLGPTMMVVPVRDFKRLAEKSSADGEVVYAMAFGIRPGSITRWRPYLTPAENLIEGFGASTAVGAGVEEAIAEPQPTWRSDLGFLGESEVVRRLAQDADLNLFRPFPDLETAELAILHRQTRHGRFADQDDRG